MLDPLPLTIVWPHLFVSCMSCLGDHFYYTCCIVQLPSSCEFLAECRGIPHTEVSSPGSPFWSQAAVPWQLNHFVTCVSVLCPHGSSASSSSTLWSSLLAWGFPVWKTLNIIGRPLSTQPLKRVPETASSCSFFGDSCHLMKKLSRNLELQLRSCATKITTIGVSTPLNLFCKSFQAFASSPIPSALTQSSLISMKFVASRVRARCHHSFVSPWCLHFPSHMHPLA